MENRVVDVIRRLRPSVRPMCADRSSFTSWLGSLVRSAFYVWVIVGAYRNTKGEHTHIHTHMHTAKWENWLRANRVRQRGRLHVSLCCVEMALGSYTKINRYCFATTWDMTFLATPFNARPSIDTFTQTHTHLQFGLHTGHSPLDIHFNLTHMLSSLHFTCPRYTLTLYLRSILTLFRM